MSNIDYKKKAFKYKVKYIELKNKLEKIKFKGGVPEWYNRFESDLLNIYQLVKNSYSTDVDPILTGSGAIAYILNYLSMNEDLDNLVSYQINPHDLDFLYISKTGLINPDKLGIFNINPAQKRETSVTFTIGSESAGNYIKSFDVTKIDRVKYFKINTINIINLKSLSSFYTSDFLDDEEKIQKDRLKKNLIKKIIDKIEADGREAEFGFVEEPELREKTNKKSSSLFGDGNDSDDERPMKSNKKPSSLFGDDSDDEKAMKSNKKPSSLFGDDSDDDF